MIRQNTGRARERACSSVSGFAGEDSSCWPGEFRDPGSQALFAQWQSRRIGRRVPARGDIDPRAVLGLFPWTGLLAADVPRVFRWRTAGSGLIGLWGRNLIGRDFTEAWPEFDRHIAIRAFARATDRLEPFVAQLGMAAMDGTSMKAELIGLPIEARPSGQRQVLCGLFPLDEPDWLGHAAPVRFEVQGLRPIEIEPLLEAAEPAAPKRKRAHVVLRLVEAQT